MQGLYELEDGEFEGSFFGVYSDKPDAYANLDEFANEVFEEFENEFDSFYDDYDDEETANQAIIASIKKRTRAGYGRFSVDGFFFFLRSSFHPTAFPVLYFEV